MSSVRQDLFVGFGPKDIQPLLKPMARLPGAIKKDACENERARVFDQMVSVYVRFEIPGKVGRLSVKTFAEIAIREIGLAPVDDPMRSRIGVPCHRPS